MAHVFQFGPESQPEQLEAELGTQIRALIDTPLPAYEVGVEHNSTIRMRDLDTAYGTYWQRDVLFSDGQRHTELIGEARHISSDILVAGIPAWWTSPRAGFNKETTDKLHKLGFNTLIKGVAENRAAALSRGAYDLHASLRDNEHNFDGRLIIQGDSNGAMQGTGVLAYAPDFGHNVVDAYLVDPCIARQIGRTDVKKALRHPSYPIMEAFSLGRQAVRIALDPEEHPLEYVRTVEPSLGFLVGNLLLTPALLSGEFGHLLAHIPDGQQGHYLAFRHSLANQKQFMGQILQAVGEQRPLDITVEVRSGTHTSIANPRTIRSKVSYISTYAEGEPLAA